MLGPLLLKIVAATPADLLERGREGEIGESTFPPDCDAVTSKSQLSDAVQVVPRIAECQL
jgi:hypothetical protein